MGALLTLASVTAATAAIEVQKAVTWRHTLWGWYGPSSYIPVVAIMLVPCALLPSGVYTVLYYWMIGIAPEVGRFFFAWLLLSALFTFSFHDLHAITFAVNGKLGAGMTMLGLVVGVTARGNVDQAPAPSPSPGTFAPCW